jgi:peptidoglycan/xylan/chitin deacetylase (PgdA/CDA1 family)
MLRLLTSLFLAIFMPAKPPLAVVISQPIEAIPSQYFSQNIIFHGATESAKLALTFDADMTPKMSRSMIPGDESVWFNKKVIDILKATHTPATLFLTGMWIETHPHTSLELAGEPQFELGNHSYSHPAFTNPCFGLSPIESDQKISEIVKTQSLIKQLTGQDNLYFRFPGGCYSQKDLALVKSLGLLSIQWNSEGPDSFNENTSQIIQNLKHYTKNGAIIVLHLDGGKNAPKTAEAISQYIPWARSQGYVFVKLTDILR